MRKILVCAMLLGACGGGSNNAAPMLIAGGGVGSGAVDGLVNVYAIDSQTKAPISGATVVVGALMATTDSTGLATIKGGTLKGPQTITVTASNYATTTFVGANGANVTIPLDSNMAVTPDSATTMGTITGWDSLPAPAMGHYFIAYVMYSLTPNLGDPANSIQTPQGSLMGVPVPGNACFKLTQPIMVSQCAWQLKSRTGAQTHYAIILDGDAHGTLSFADDTYTVYGYAEKTGLTLTKDAMVSNEALTMVADADEQTATVSFPTAPAGLAQSGAFPIIDNGTDWVALVIPGVTPMSTTLKIPKLTGDFAGAKYNLVASAQADMNTKSPSTNEIQKNIDLGQTYTIPAWLPTPTSVSATAGTYSFTAATGAIVHSAKFTDSTGKTSWNVTLLDDSTSFTTPTGITDPLPAGMVTLTVTALDIPNFDVTNFSIDAVKNTVVRTSENHTTFTH
jgi:hypothetical protein